ncbi:hypothetical protein OH77DRAFT_1440337 [Trametes cingulata]|nr:hypothetical protein OH77DRAFT_1440337 [Trametes cingulata]
MSLPTPPGTSHRDEKENRGPRFSRVSWCETAEYHAITSSPPRTLSAQSRASRAGPSRSILKKPAHPITLFTDEKVKESTPEPSDPLADLHYLEGPVSRILAPDASLRDLIEAYSILTARLRACVSDSTDADASWPLFQPLRKQRDLFVEALVRDIRQVFFDPLEGCSSSTDPMSSPRGEPSSLPSPRDSPKKKRGMSEEQVKRARDLCGVCHAVLRLLSLLFTIPALYQLFTASTNDLFGFRRVNLPGLPEDELGYILTQVLAIPLANELPTPNARKTCALAIWLIQAQRLPAEVLEPAKDRIAYALRRGIEGELGKEGKKGSTSDGLKAVHDLSLYQPSIFVPAFAPLLPAVLSNLLAPTLVLRNQACHALGGFALAVASLPPSEAHTRISTAVAARLVKRVDVTGPLSPSKKALASPSTDPPLVRTLRTTLQTTDPKHAAQGPVWAFSVISHLVVLLGPTVYLHSELTRTIMALFSLGMRHPKSSVRGLGCLAWRAMTWAYFRPPHVKLTVTAETDDEDDESATEEDLAEERKKHQETLRACFRYLTSVVDMGAGIGTIGALLGQEVTEDAHLRGAMRVLRAMSKKGGQTCKDSMDVARHLLGCAASPDQPPTAEWEHRKLLAPGLFSANPGLLTAEWKTLSACVKGVLDQCPHIADIRPLTLEEIATDGMWDEFLAVWKDAVSVLRLQWGSEEVPGLQSEIREIWFNLLKSHAAPLLDAEDHDGLMELVKRARDVLIEVLDEDSFDFTMRKEELGEEIPTSPVKPTSSRKGKASDEPLPESRWNYAVKLFLVRDLFTITRAVFPEDVFAYLAESVLKHLNSNEEALVGDVQCSDEVREQWSSLCAEAALTCDIGVLQAFWSNKLGKPGNGQRDSDWDVDVRIAVWQAFLDRWEDSKRSWEAAIVLLSVPFVEASGWELSSEDLTAWDEFLKRSIDAALDCGVDAPALIDHIAGAVAAGQAPGATSSVRVADLLLSNLEIAEAREVPTELLEFANDTLVAAYPPAPRHKVMCMWLVRSLTRVVDACPRELCFQALHLLVDGLCVWFADEYDICTVDDYSSDILPLYQTILVTIQGLEKNTYYLECFAPLLEAPFRGRQDKHVGIVEAFADFWQETYAEVPQPSSGWPEQVVRCLEAVAREQEDEASVENLTALADDCPSPGGEDVRAHAGSDDECSVEPPSPMGLSRLSGPLLKPALFSRESSPELPLLLAPSTPKSSPRALPVTTPSRPHKSAIKEPGAAPFPAASPASSAMDSSPIRAPTTPKRSPAKAGTGNKENMSPLPRVATVAERLAISPLLLESILGKRSRGDEIEDSDLAEKAFKRGRLEASPLAPSAAFSNAVHVRMVMHNDAPELLKGAAVEVPAPSTRTTEECKVEEDNGSSSSSDSETASISVSSSASRKRKGVFLDAVVVPPVPDVLRLKRRLSFEDDGELLSNDRGSSSDKPEQPVLRRTRSATKLLGGQVDFQRLDYTPKKRRMSRAHQLREEAASGPASSPSRALRDAQLFGSDDSIMLASPSKAAELPPSDDDQPLGQLTPHRLVSPALRRVQHVEFSSDPPSDDSTLSNSPSSERVVRKMARLGSERSVRVTPLQIRPRSVSEFSSFSAFGSDL